MPARHEFRLLLALLPAELSEHCASQLATPIANTSRLQQAVGCSCKCYRCCVADVCLRVGQATRITWFQHCCERLCTCSNAKSHGSKDGGADLEAGRKLQFAPKRASKKRSTRRVCRLLCCELNAAGRAGRCCRKLRLHEPGRFIIFIVIYTVALFAMFSRHASSQLAVKPVQ